MANIITAGNSTNGGTAITTDTSGTLNIVTGSGSGVTALSIDASGNVSGVLKSGTAVTASGTSVDFTGIPSTAKRVTVVFNGISTSGTSNIQIQIGAGSVTTSGYLSYAVQSGTAGNGGISATSGFILTFSIVAASVQYGALVLNNISSNSWVASLAAGGTDSSSNPVGRSGGGSISLGGTLDRVRLTTVNGTDTFDAGTINIFYE